MSAELVFTKGTTPTLTPPAGTSSIYAKTSDGKFYTMDGDTGVETSLVGPTGATGATGAGVPAGGTAGQALVKNSTTNYDTSWQDLTITEALSVALTGTSTLGAVKQVVEVNSASPCTITLPAAFQMLVTILGNQHSLPIVIFNTGTTVVTIAANGTDLINGAATAKLQFKWSSITLYPNAAGTGWMIV